MNLRDNITKDFFKKSYMYENIITNREKGIILQWSSGKSKPHVYIFA